MGASMSKILEIINRKFNEQRKLQSECRIKMYSDEYVYAYAAQILEELRKEITANKKNSSPIESL